MSDETAPVDVNMPISTAPDQQSESFPALMSGVESIRRIDARRSRWVTDIGGVHREFDVAITEQPGSEIGGSRGDLPSPGQV